MKRWDGMMEGYLKQCETRGLSESTLVGLRHELERWGLWLKRNRPAEPSYGEGSGCGRMSG